MKGEIPLRQFQLLARPEFARLPDAGWRRVPQRLDRELLPELAAGEQAGGGAPQRHPHLLILLLLQAQDVSWRISLLLCSVRTLV